MNAVEGIFIRELKWIFREQTISDWGIDAHVEVTTRDEPTGRLLALQIKSGKTFRATMLAPLVMLTMQSDRHALWVQERDAKNRAAGVRLSPQTDMPTQPEISAVEG